MKDIWSKNTVKCRSELGESFAALVLLMDEKSHSRELSDEDLRKSPNHEVSSSPGCHEILPQGPVPLGPSSF